MSEKVVLNHFICQGFRLYRGVFNGVRINATMDYGLLMMPHS
jgi:hypothetical protein